MIPSDEYPSIYEMSLLMANPETRERMYMAMKKLEAEDAGEIKAYSELIESFKRGILASRDLWEAPDRPIRTFWFEAIDLEVDQWIVRSLVPAPPPGLEKAEILPKDLLLDMANTLISDREIYKFSDQPSQITERCYDLRFMHLSRYTICGSVSVNLEKSMSRREVYTNGSGPVHEQVACLTLYSYMQRYPQVMTFMLNEFFGIVKPMMDGAADKNEIKEDFETFRGEGGRFQSSDNAG